MLRSFSELIGRFHPLLVHLPIGILLIALLLQWLSHKKGYGIAHGVLKMLWALGAASALLACITGYILSVHDDYDDNAVALHMWSGIAVAAVSLFLLAKVASRQYDNLYKASAAVLFLLIAAAGHFGGSLTHGADYLTAPFSGSARADSGGIKPIANVPEAQVYSAIIQPIIQTKCYSCHGAQKQKGGLRLDDSAWILKGGKEGLVLLPGQASESDLVKSLLLPREEKLHMPPKEKPQLTKDQIALVQWWVDAGAPFHQQVKNLPQPEKIKPVLAALQHGDLKKLPDAIVPETPVEAADTAALNALKRRGVSVIPVAQNSNYLAVNFASATAVNDVDIVALLPLKKQLVWLKAGNTNITDKAMATLAQCTNLYSLWLNNTAVTDAGIALLRSLVKLQNLNLVAMPVTATGMLSLKPLQQLQSIYLYQTKIKRSDWPLLQKTFPETHIDTGGYTVPTLAGDTSILGPAYK